MRRVYDAARTPLDRLLSTGTLPEEMKWKLRSRVQQIDPLALSEHLDALRYALLCHAHLPAGIAVTRPRLDFTLTICTARSQAVQETEPERREHQASLMPERNEILSWSRSTRDPLAGAWEEIFALVQEHPEWNSTQILQELGRRDPERELSSCTGTLIQGIARIRQQIRACWEEPWPTELIQASLSERLDAPLPWDGDTASHADSGTGMLAPVSNAQEHTVADQSISSHQPGVSTRTHIRPLAVTIEHAMEIYLRDLCELGRETKTVEWHQLSLSALRQYLWQHFRLTEVHQLSRATLQCWLADLRTTPSAWTGEPFSVNTMAAYARSVRAFCNWLVRQEYLPETPFPKDVMPKAERYLPQTIDQETFGSLLHACQLPDGHAGQDRKMTMRNQAILWLLLDTGISASELCGLRLGDVDPSKGTVTVRGKGGRARTLLLSEEGRCAVSRYLGCARLTPAWQPAVPKAQSAFLLTELRQPLTQNSLTLLFARLNQRAGLTPRPIRPALLRDTYAIRFLQAGGDLSMLQERLGLANLLSVQRYQSSCNELQRVEVGASAVSEERTKPPRLSRRSKSQRRKTRK